MGLLAFLMGGRLDEQILTDADVQRMRRRLQREESYELENDVLQSLATILPDAWYFEDDNTLVVQEVVKTSDIDVRRYTLLWADLDAIEELDLRLEIWTTHAGGQLAATYDQDYFVDDYYAAIKEHAA